mgnify:FL=1
MSETKYHFRREGNHFKLSSSQNRSEQAERPTPVQPIAPKRAKRSIWSRIGSFFGILFSGIVMIFGFLIATPFFLLSVLLNWVIMFIGLSIFWVLSFFAFHAFVLDSVEAGNPFESGWTVFIILMIALLGAILSTIAQIRE